MRLVKKKINWKNVTFSTPKINFLNWASGGVAVKISDEVYEFKTDKELEALRLSIQPSWKGNDSCFITVEELKSIYFKTKERMKQIKLLNGEVYDKEKLINRMYDDSFYYGELGKNALSSSPIKNLLDSPKAYSRSLNYNEDSDPFKMGRLIHLAALEPEKLETLCHVVEVQSENTKKYKEKVAEIGDNRYIFTRKMYDKGMYTVDSLLQNDIWMEYTRKAKFEEPGFDILHGYPFRAKADVLGLDYIADLKTTSDLKSFQWSAKKYSYDVQVYIYCQIFGIDYRDFIFFVIDKATGDLGIWDVKESAYNRGKEKVEYAIRIFEKYFIKQEEDINSYVIKGSLE